MQWIHISQYYLNDHTWLFISRLFKNAARDSHHTAPNDWLMTVYNDLQIMWDEEAMA
jgi:hypothetical protein